MKTIWNSIENWLENNASEVLEGLQPGTTDEELDSGEEFMGVDLPEDVKCSYRIHNGQSSISPPLMGEWQLLSIKSMKREWKVMQDLLDAGNLEGEARSDGKVRSEWWNSKWIPIAHNGAGDFYCLDLAPTSIGKIGQIISFWHMNEKRQVLANSFQDLLQGLADDLKNGKYKVEDGGLLRIHT